MLVSTSYLHLYASIVKTWQLFEMMPSSISKQSHRYSIKLFLLWSTSIKILSLMFCIFILCLYLSLLVCNFQIWNIVINIAHNVPQIKLNNVFLSLHFTNTLLRWQSWSRKCYFVSDSLKYLHWPFFGISIVFNLGTHFHSNWKVENI